MRAPDGGGARLTRLICRRPGVGDLDSKMPRRPLHIRNSNGGSRAEWMYPSFALADPSWQRARLGRLSVGAPGCPDADATNSTAAATRSSDGPAPGRLGRSVCLSTLQGRAYIGGGGAQLRRVPAALPFRQRHPASCCRGGIAAQSRVGFRARITVAAAHGSKSIPFPVALE
jgi:hypothetical protein